MRDPLLWLVLLFVALLILMPHSAHYSARSFPGCRGQSIQQGVLLISPWRTPGWWRSQA
jgi:hypothetical protein